MTDRRKCSDCATDSGEECKRHACPICGGPKQRWSRLCALCRVEYLKLGYGRQYNERYSVEALERTRQRRLIHAQEADR